MNCLFLLPKNFNWKYKVNQKFSSCECLRNNLSAWSFSCIICKANTKILVIPNIERNWEDHVDISIVSREPVSVLCCNNRSSLLMMPHEINLYSDSCCITQNSFCLRCFFFSFSFPSSSFFWSLSLSYNGLRCYYFTTWGRLPGIPEQCYSCTGAKSRWELHHSSQLQY